MISEAFTERSERNPRTVERLAEKPKGLNPNSSDLIKTGISAELDTLKYLVNNAHEYVTMLEEKTSAFRKIAPRCEEVEKQPLRGAQSPLTEQLFEQNVRLHALCNRMSDLVEDIDL